MGSSETPPAHEIRQSQRAPQSCATCARRRVKCSKTVPCLQCLDRGLGAQCQREPVKVKGRIVNVSSPISVDVNQLQAQVLHLRQRIAELEQSRDGDLRDADEDTIAVDGDRLHLLIKGVEFSALGVFPQPGFDSSAPLADLSPGLQQPIVFLKAQIPAQIITESLLEYAHTSIWWHHCSYHVPTFRAQTQKMWNDPESGVTWSWAGLFFAVLAAALYYVEENHAKALGIAPDRLKSLPNAWTKAALQCLLWGDYLAHPTLTSVQALAVLTGFTHSVGTITLHTTTVSTGVRLSQSLGLHRLGREPVCELADMNGYCPAHGVNIPHLQIDADTVQREIGRRAWLVFMITEYMSWQARESNGLPFHGDSVPLNMDDVDVGQLAFPQAKGETTLVSHHLGMYELAMDAYDAFNSSRPRLSILVDLDVRLRQQLARTPSRPESSKPYTTWTQHVRRLGLQHRRLVLHRPYFARSFQDPKMVAARETCVEAAEAILAERRKVFPKHYEKIWSVMNHTFAAGVVLLLDYFYSGYAVKRWTQVYEIWEALARDPDGPPFVQRAAASLLSLLSDEKRFRPEMQETELPVTTMDPSTSAAVPSHQPFETTHIVHDNHSSQLISLGALESPPFGEVGPATTRTENEVSNWLEELQDAVGHGGDRVDSLLSQWLSDTH